MARIHRSSETSPAGVVVWLVLFAVGATGWVYNIVKLAGMDWDAALGIEAVLRIVGIPAAPLGAIMGLFV